MTNWPPKDPNETIKYVADFSDALGQESIASHTLSVESGDATIADQDQSVRSIEVFIAGGTDETSSVFLFTVTSNAGQIIERRYSLYVASGLSATKTTSTSKRQLVEQMFTECTLSGWEYDITGDEKQAALTRLDALMWELTGRGIDLGYNFPTAIGAGDLDDDLGCPDQAFFGLAILGAERLCPTMGKTQSKESRIALNSAMKAVRSAAAVLIPSVQLAPGTPIGSGNKPRYYPYSMTS